MTRFVAWALSFRLNAFFVMRHIFYDTELQRKTLGQLLGQVKYNVTSCHKSKIKSTQRPIFLANITLAREDKPL